MYNLRGTQEKWSLFLTLYGLPIDHWCTLHLYLHFSMHFILICIHSYVVNLWHRANSKIHTFRRTPLWSLIFIEDVSVCYNACRCSRKKGTNNVNDIVHLHFIIFFGFFNNRFQLMTPDKSTWPYHGFSWLISKKKNCNNWKIFSWKNYEIWESLEKKFFIYFWHKIWWNWKFQYYEEILKIWSFLKEFPKF